MEKRFSPSLYSHEEIVKIAEEELKESGPLGKSVLTKLILRRMGQLYPNSYNKTISEVFDRMLSEGRINFEKKGSKPGSKTLVHLVVSESEESTAMNGKQGPAGQRTYVRFRGHIDTLMSYILEELQSGPMLKGMLIKKVLHRLGIENPSPNHASVRRILNTMVASGKVCTWQRRPGDHRRGIFYCLPTNKPDSTAHEADTGDRDVLAIVRLLDARIDALLLKMEERQQVEQSILDRLRVLEKKLPGRKSADKRKRRDPKFPVSE
jgi:hypothetical protein